MAETQQVYLSLVIPAFNEEARIGKSLERILSFLSSQPYSYEVIIVDDGSQDRTVEVVQQRCTAEDKVRIERQSRNLGKGQAIKQGMLLAKGKYLFFSDADLSVPIETLSLFLSSLEKGIDVAVGTRQMAGAVIEFHQPLYRELMGRVFTQLSNWILGLWVSDFTCGFKGFRRGAARDLFSQQQLRNWSFDPEILFLAQRKGFKIKEVPVTWRDDRRTKVRLRSDIFTSFLGLLKIRLNQILGKYK